MFNFKTNVRYTFQSDLQSLTQEGIQAVKRLLSIQRPYQAGYSHHTYLPSLPELFVWEWEAKDGKLPKRIAKYYRLLGIDIPQGLVEEIGNVAKPHVNVRLVYEFDFTRKFDWQAGDFGDDGSCYWADRSGARVVLRRNGAYAVRFYTPTLSRAWFVPYGQFAILFNGYGMTTVEIARVLGQYFGQPYKQIGLVNNRYASGMVFINSGKGYVLGQFGDESYDFNWHTDVMIACQECGDKSRQDDLYTTPNGDLLCGQCFYEDWDICSACGGTYEHDDIYHVYDGSYCYSCYEDRGGWYCEHCGQDYLDDVTPHAHNDSQYCDRCYERLGLAPQTK